MGILSYGKCFLVCMFAVVALAGPAAAGIWPASTVSPYDACIGPLVSQPVCAPAASAPHALAGTYVAARDTLALSWDAPTVGTPDSYNVYRDGAIIGSSTTMASGDNLDTITGVHAYYVTAVAAGVESVQSNTLWLVKGGGNPPTVVCDPLIVGVYLAPTFVFYGVRQECMPPLPPV